jgi:hypothetical protein
MSGLPSDDLVEDYKISLEDLTTNDRFQINNLTVIARENTEHAMAISRVLENHIGQVGLSISHLATGHVPDGHCRRLPCRNCRLFM